MVEISEGVTLNHVPTTDLKNTFKDNVLYVIINIVVKF